MAASPTNDVAPPRLAVDDLRIAYGPASDEARGRYAEIAARFQELFGRRPSAFVRAPGRVNLIGEHIDYHGYSVMPMALRQDVVIALAATPDAAACVRVANMDAGYDPRELPLDPSVPVAAASHHWSNYFHCGYKAALERGEAAAAAAPVAFAALVDGRVPRAAGLSSSSALVVASCMAAAEANGIALGRASLAEATRVAERFVGTMGGGMDQAISCLAQDGCAMHIQFGPLSAHPVPMPPGVAVVVANSLAVAEKAVTAATGFNKRVVEGRLAAQVLGARCGIPLAEAGAIRSFSQLQRRLVAAGVLSAGDPADQLTQMAQLAREHLESREYSAHEIGGILGQPVSQAAQFPDRPAAALVFAASDAFALRARALHVCTEAARVIMFRRACEQPGVSGEALGALMSASHASCRDDYACSCAELDALVSAMEGAGAFGARLTGAGWGGCAVALVADAQVPAVLAAVQRLYALWGVEAELAARSVFVSAAGCGAAVVLPE